MSCKAWEALATVTTAVTLIAGIAFDVRFLAIFWQPTDGKEWERYTRLRRRFVPWWSVCALTAVVSLVVVVVHCT